MRNSSSRYRLPNPLTVHERLQIPRLISHDSNGNLTSILGVAEGLRRKSSLRQFYRLAHKLQHSDQIESTVESLTQLDAFSLDRINSTYRFDRSSVKEYINMLEEVTGRNIKLRVHSFSEFLTNNHVFYTMIYNLVKNACKANPGESLIGLCINVRNSFPEKAIYLPSHSRGYNDFVQFSIHSEAAFPKDMTLRERIVKSAPMKRGSGLGLYYVKLAAKVLRSPIDIQSNGRNGTTVSIYHPIY